MSEANTTPDPSEKLVREPVIDTAQSLEDRSKLLAETLRIKMVGDTHDFYEGIKIPLEEGEQAK
jgi:hypothetical protein